MEQVKTLCGFEVCEYVFGIDDIKHSIWPSHDIAKDIINKFKSY
jgi:hypothetical protein